MDHGAGVTPMKEKGKEGRLGGKRHRLQRTSKKFQLGQWKVLAAKSPICQEWTFLPVPHQSLARSSSWEAWHWWEHSGRFGA